MSTGAIRRAAHSPRETETALPMKYELATDNRGQPDEVLLEDLRSTAAKLNVTTLTRAAYESAGRFAAATVSARFGSWGKALAKARLKSARHFDVSREDCLADLKRVAAEALGAAVTVKLYRSLGRFSEKPFRVHFGTWSAALEAAGLSVSAHYHERSADEQLLENLESVWQALGGSQPSTTCHRPCRGSQRTSTSGGSVDFIVHLKSLSSR